MRWYSEFSMAKIADLNFRHRIFLATYRFRRIDPVPWTPLKKPVQECRVALVTTAAFHGPDQEPFDEDVKGGDPSFRILPAPPPGESITRLDLRIAHRSDAFDPAGIESDKNMGLPLDRLRELEAEGKIGSVAPRHLSFMGSITAPGRLASRTAPQAAAMLQEDQVDVVVLCPV